MQEQKNLETKEYRRRHGDWNSKLNAAVDQQLAKFKMHAPPLLEK
jgi:hypothetical protein